ncbi:YibE/F family protein [Pullulanibacillus camelliae]|nr:YibE/F family protein [Pullulanibacillus camelliae]
MKRLWTRLSRKQILFYILGLLCLCLAITFTSHDAFLYKKPLAEVIKIKTVKTKQIDANHSKDALFSQKITAKMKNGKYKGQLIHLTNQYSQSGAYDQKYGEGNTLFVSIESHGHHKLGGTITGAKRDKPIVIIVGLFLFVLLAIGKRQGLYSIISLFINIVLLLVALNLFLDFQQSSLLLVGMGAVVLFTVISLLLVSGRQEKTYVAIIATLISTFVALLIAYAALKLTDSNGLHFESMQFVLIPPQEVFMAQILIGSLGAVMDLAITLTSSVYELYEKSETLSRKALMRSGREIGGDVMGAMTNILFFAYISGTIPIILLYLKNGYPLIDTFSLNLSLELVRALAGSIGIVLTIPITLYLSMLFIFRKEKRT